MPLFGKPGERIAYSVHRRLVGAPPLFLVHGFTASRASFANNIEPLSEHFTVVMVELLGHGDSDAPGDVRPYGPGPAVERILGLMGHLGYERVLLCGHSLGGALALRLAIEAPERLAGLVVINSNSAAGTPAWRETARLGMAEIGARVRREGKDFLKKTRLYPAHSKRLPPEVREQLVRDFDRMQDAGVAGTAEALTVGVNVYERLPWLRVPTLVVIGELDRDFVENAPQFIERMPTGMVRAVTIAGGGHAANVERREAFEAALLEFAAGVGYIDPPEPPPDAPGRGHPGGPAATAIGLVLIAAGTALVATSVMVGDDEPGRIEEGLALAASPTVDMVAGEETRETTTASEPVSTATPTGAATDGAAVAPPATATSTPTEEPAATATPEPTEEPLATPAPTEEPTATPEPSPTEAPVPAETPTPEATVEPMPTTETVEPPATPTPGEASS